MPLKIHLLVDEWQTTMQLHNCWRKRLPLIGVSSLLSPLLKKCIIITRLIVSIWCSIVGCPFPQTQRRTKVQTSRLDPGARYRAEIVPLSRPTSPLLCGSLTLPMYRPACWWWADQCISVLGRRHIQPEKWGRIGTAFLQAWRLLHLFV